MSVNGAKCGCGDGAETRFTWAFLRLMSGRVCRMTGVGASQAIQKNRNDSYAQQALALTSTRADGEAARGAPLTLLARSVIQSG
jgi:hypothetical protein